MSKVVALTSQKAAKSAQKLAQRIQEVCTGEDMTIVTCALMAGRVDATSRPSGDCRRRDRAPNERGKPCLK